ncbi:FAD-binding oxidoreductase [Clostridium akagii]|uniref:FAD-binding oxidoreductase n=1 Tax=Clostridium akagii TaxID=91623 RepID=UPI00047C7D0C|nr:FAD-dependent oxidoreductase [Clostridium akagii]
MSFNELTGKVITPSDKEYDILRLEYNLAINKFPLAIVYCYDYVDVSNAIKWCRRNHVRLRIRNGGHNYEGYSTGTGILIIDTLYMNKIDIDTEQNIAKIQSGALLGNIYSKLWDQGYGFYGGTCPSVGISGLVLGGGIGLSCRNFGLVTDNLLELQIVDESGKLLTVNRNINPELFWACRGAGGGNFGVVICYTFKVYKVDKITLIQLRWDGSSRDKFFDLWQRWLKTAPIKISCFSGFNKNSIYLNGFFYGSKSEAEKILEKFLLLPGLLDDSSIEHVPFIDAVGAIGSFYGPPNRFKATGRFVYRTLTKGNIKNLIEYVDMSPGEDSCYIRLYSLGGKIKNLPNNYSAYYYRSAKYIIGITADWEKDENAKLYTSWVEEVFKYVKPLTDGCYVNFPYAELKNYGYAYYGGNYHDLKKVKRTYDPNDIFKFQQSIKP